MPVHVGSVESSVELTGVPPRGAAGGEGGGGGAPVLPTWQERERLQQLRELACRDADRLAGEGVGA